MWVVSVWFEECVRVVSVWFEECVRVVMRAGS